MGDRKAEPPDHPIGSATNRWLQGYPVGTGAAHGKINVRTHHINRPTSSPRAGSLPRNAIVGVDVHQSRRAAHWLKFDFTSARLLPAAHRSLPQVPPNGLSFVGHDRQLGVEVHQPLLKLLDFDRELVDLRLDDCRWVGNVRCFSLHHSHGLGIRPPRVWRRLTSTRTLVRVGVEGQTVEDFSPPGHPKGWIDGSTKQGTGRSAVVSSLSLRRQRSREKRRVFLE